MAEVTREQVTQFTYQITLNGEEAKALASFLRSSGNATTRGPYVQDLLCRLDAACPDALRRWWS